MPGRTDYVYLSGKAKWAKLEIPDSKYGDPKWKITLYPDAESLEKIRDLLKEPSVKNVLSQDEDGYYMNFSRKTAQMIRGKLATFNPPEVLDGSKPLPEGGYQPLRDALVGNGSDVTIKIEVFPIIKGAHRACRLLSVRVDNLVPYNINRDFDPEQKRMVEGLDGQPSPGF